MIHCTWISIVRLLVDLREHTSRRVVLWTIEPGLLSKMDALTLQSCACTTAGPLQPDTFRKLGSQYQERHRFSCSCLDGAKFAPREGCSAASAIAKLSQVAPTSDGQHRPPHQALPIRLPQVSLSACSLEHAQLRGYQPHASERCDTDAEAEEPRLRQANVASLR